TSLITEAILSGAVSGTFIIIPEPVFSAFKALPFTNKFAAIAIFFTPESSNFPSAGQSNTERYNVVVFVSVFAFIVHLPHANGGKGLAFVAYIASLFTFIHAPISFNSSILSTGKVPSDLGPTFNK